MITTKKANKFRNKIKYNKKLKIVFLNNITIKSNILKSMTI